MEIFASLLNLAVSYSDFQLWRVKNHQNSIFKVTFLCQLIWTKNLFDYLISANNCHDNYSFLNLQIEENVKYLLQYLQNHLHKTFFSVKTMQGRKLFEELQYTNVLSKKLKSVLCWLCITVLHNLGHAIVLGWRVHTRLRWNDKRVEDTKIRSQLEIATTRSN